MKEIDLEMLKGFKVDFALTLHIKHHEADLVFLFLGAVVDYVCVVNVVNAADESLLGKGFGCDARLEKDCLEHPLTDEEIAKDPNHLFELLLVQNFFTVFN